MKCSRVFAVAMSLCILSLASCKSRDDANAKGNQTNANQKDNGDGKGANQKG